MILEVITQSHANLNQLYKEQPELDEKTIQKVHYLLAQS